MSNTITPSLAWDTAASPFAAKLGTNYVPSSTELVQLNDMLVEPQKELDFLDSEIAREVKIYIDSHRALGSTIRRLPSETLAEIFQWCLPDVGYGVRSVEYAPLLLTIICRDWRRVALDTPRLWNSLHISFHPLLSEDVRSRRVAGIQSWLRRSGSLPITVSLHAISLDPLTPDYVTPGAQRPNTMAPLMKTLLGFCDRLQHLALDLSDIDLTEFRKLIPSGSSFPSLLSFKLGDSKPGRVYAKVLIDHLAALLSRMPALRNLEVELRQTESIQSHAVHGWWDSLTSLSISEPLAPTDLFTILTKSHALRTLKVGMFMDMGYNAFGLALATLGNLILLHLFCTSSAALWDTWGEAEHARHCAHVSATIAQISCPALKNLYFSWSISRPVSQLPILSFPLHALETLGLNIPMPSSALTECLSLVPNLISLDFVDDGNTFRRHQIRAIEVQSESTLHDTHLAALTPSASNLSPLCPQLRHFRMMTGFAYQGTYWSMRSLTEFVTTRAQANGLDSCELCFSSPLSDEDIHILRTAKENGGLKLHLYQLKPRPQMWYEDGPMAGLGSATQAGHIATVMSHPFSLGLDTIHTMVTI